MGSKRSYSNPASIRLVFKMQSCSRGEWAAIMVYPTNGKLRLIERRRFLGSRNVSHSLWIAIADNYYSYLGVIMLCLHYIILYMVISLSKDTRARLIRHTPTRVARIRDNANYLYYNNNRTAPNCIRPYYIIIMYSVLFFLITMRLLEERRVLAARRRR